MTEADAVAGGRRHRMVFVGGLHRSGTSPVARWIAMHPAVSAFEDTGVYEDEGQHLQDVYPTAGAHGGPGRFAFDADAHLTEASALASEASRERLWASWSPHWDLSKPVLLEKSPPNLVRTRFLEALFGGARFVIVIRHPIAVATATRKWMRSSRRRLLEHWLTAHELMLADAARVPELAIVRYEDVVGDPTAELGHVFRFLGLEPLDRDWEARPDLNERYFERWNPGRLVDRWAREPIPLKRPYVRRLESELEPRAARFGYSLRAPRELARPAPEVARLLARAQPANELIPSAAPDAGGGGRRAGGRPSPPAGHSPGPPPAGA
jgi:hypothetical protein